MLRFICLFLCSLALVSGLSAQELRTLNSSSPGQRFEATDYLKRDKTNIVVFVSQQSEECQRFELNLKKLASADRVIGLVDIDRADKSDVDWKSPLVRQHNLRELPYVMIFDGNKELEAEGHEARKLILKWLDETG